MFKETILCHVLSPAVRSGQLVDHPRPLICYRSFSVVFVLLCATLTYEFVPNLEVWLG